MWIRRRRGNLPVLHHYTAAHFAVCVFDGVGQGYLGNRICRFPYVNEILYNSFIATATKQAVHTLYKSLFVKKSLELYTRYGSAHSSGVNENSLFISHSEHYRHLFRIIDTKSHQFISFSRIQFFEGNDFIFATKSFKTQLFNICSEFLVRYGGYDFHEVYNESGEIIDIHGWQIVIGGTDYVK